MLLDFLGGHAILSTGKIGSIVEDNARGIVADLLQGLHDRKQQPISTLQPYLTRVQPEWENQARRVMKIQQLVQSSPPALLAAIEFNDDSYLLR
jgi:Uncharacterized protein conserved in bacteria (DUF2252)